MTIKFEDIYSIEDMLETYMIDNLMRSQDLYSGMKGFSPPTYWDEICGQTSPMVYQHKSVEVPFLSSTILTCHPNFRNPCMSAKVLDSTAVDSPSP
jgi:hypothetical protein